MTQPTYQIAPITCPNCANHFTTPVLPIIDLGQNPDLKALFLSGQVNIAVCPQCGHAGMLSTPLVYHDPEKELLFTFAPTELGAMDADQQRFVGDLTNRVISALPAEQRKGYLLQPRTFLRLEAMLDAILEADGITPKMLKAQRDRAELLDRLLRATSEDARQVIARENDVQIDYEFFQLLTMNLDLAQRGEQTEIAQQLLELRTQLLDWTTHGEEITARNDAIRSLGREITREGLLDKVVEAALAGEQSKVVAMATVGRPAIDYVFYQQLTSRIEAAEQAGETANAETLQALRESILDLTAEIDAEIQQETLRASETLGTILESDDPETAIRDNLLQIDEFFLNVLGLHLEAAEKAGRKDDVAKLTQISDVIMKLFQESQPPEIQLMSQLLDADYPDGTRALLEENREQVDARLLEVMDLLGQDLATGDQEEISQQLAQVREQAAAMVEATP